MTRPTVVAAVSRVDMSPRIPTRCHGAQGSLEGAERRASKRRPLRECIPQDTARLHEGKTWPDG